MVLIYALHSGSADEDADPFVCWYGYPPKAQLASGRVDAERLPAGVRLLYTKLHNSFCLAGLLGRGGGENAESRALVGLCLVLGNQNMSHRCLPSIVQSQVANALGTDSTK